MSDQMGIGFEMAPSEVEAAQLRHLETDADWRALTENLAKLAGRSGNPPLWFRYSQWYVRPHHERAAFSRLVAGMVYAVMFADARPDVIEATIVAWASSHGISLNPRSPHASPVTDRAGIRTHPGAGSAGGSGGGAGAEPLP